MFGIPIKMINDDYLGNYSILEQPDPANFVVNSVEKPIK